MRFSVALNLFFHKSGFLSGAVCFFFIDKSYGRGGWLGRGRGVGAILGVGVAVGVEVGVGVRVAAAVAGGVGLGVPSDCAQYLPPLFNTT